MKDLDEMHQHVNIKCGLEIMKFL